MKHTFIPQIAVVAALLLSRITAEAQTSLLAKPFTSETNYMSLSGYQRWSHYRETGEWLQFVVTKDIGNVSSDVESLLSKIYLAKSIKENPVAVKHVIIWSFEILMPDYDWSFKQRFVYDKSKSTLLLETQDESTGVWNMRRSSKMTEAQVLAVGARQEQWFIQAAKESNKHQK